MTQPNTNPSPKSKFVAIKHCVDQHRELIARPDFQLGIETALVQMIWVHSSGGEHALSVPGTSAAEKFYRVQGAMELIRTIKTLAESQAPIPAPDPGDIDHTFK